MLWDGAVILQHCADGALLCWTSRLKSRERGKTRKHTTGVAVTVDA